MRRKKEQVEMTVSRTIIARCGVCTNEEFRVIETAVKPTFHRSGYYRAKCTLCGHQETFKSLNPSDNE